jgi:hypothetical protein
MGKAATKAKNKYNGKTYDRAEIFFKKGQKELISARARALGLSLNAYITELIERDTATGKQNGGEPKPNGKI